ncbi:MAG: hypothetical protein HOH04_02815 [Rhodospirillaceae bacterium]|nr:hypothetical protein [Rhodospirillaceae bacterium]
MIGLLASLCLFFKGLIPGDTALAQDRVTFTQGPGRADNTALMECQGYRSRPSAIGTVSAEDGSQWTVPGPVHFSTALFADDLYNDCSGKRYRGPEDIDLSAIPVRTHAGGEETFTAYVFADNYFEFYVNGKRLAVDPVPFTPFNSNVIRFTASRPFTVAAMLVDWEESLGVGTEQGWGASHHPGDGGFVAVIKDANGDTVAITDAGWRVQTYYIAPLQSRNCLKVNGGMRDSRGCSSPDRENAQLLYAAHWRVPENWAAKTFDDSTWPQATTFSNNTVGVDNKRAYTNFSAIFDDRRNDAKFIWSPNLVLDNLVLARRTIR